MDVGKIKTTFTALNKSEYIGCKQSLAKWILHFILLFGTLTFSGYSFANEITRHSPAQTEVLSVTQEKKHAVTFTTSVSHHPHGNPYAQHSHHDLLLAYATVLKVKINHHSKQVPLIASCIKALTFQYAPRLAVDHIITPSQG